MNDFRAAIPRFHGPLESHRMIFGHRRAHDENGVGIRKVLLRCGCAAASERSAQTGHRRAMSYTGLIAHAHHAKAGGEELLDEIIFLVVERRAAEMRDGRCAHHGLPVFLFDERALARRPHTLSYHVHGLVETNLLPCGAARAAIEHLGGALWMRDQLIACRAFWTQMPP